jgi:hypothetical protein
MINVTVIWALRQEVSVVVFDVVHVDGVRLCP